MYIFSKFEHYFDHAFLAKCDHFGLSFSFLLYFKGSKIVTIQKTKVEDKNEYFKSIKIKMDQRYKYRNNEHFKNTRTKMKKKLYLNLFVRVELKLF